LLLLLLPKQPLPLLRLCFPAAATVQLPLLPPPLLLLLLQQPLLPLLCACRYRWKYLVTFDA
jgi:hypothetical protein